MNSEIVFNLPLGALAVFLASNSFIQAQKELDENAQHKIPKGNKDENETGWIFLATSGNGSLLLASTILNIQ